MDIAVIKKWVVFFIGILAAIIIADALASLVVVTSGITGWAAFLVNFILYAVFFFSILYLCEKLFHIEFFCFWKEEN
jgi:hypothetical protein